MLLLRPICGNRHQSLDRQAYLVAVSGFCRDNLANISTIIRIMIFLFWGQALAKKYVFQRPAVWRISTRPLAE